MEKFKDNYEKFFEEFGEFLKELETAERTYAPVPVNGFRFTPTEQLSDDEFDPALSEEIRLDARKCNELSVKLPNGYRPVRLSTANKTLLERMRLMCPTVSEKFDVNELSAVLNMAKKHYGFNALVLLDEGKVGAFLSEGKANYSPISAEKTVKALSAYLDENFGGSEFSGGYFSHEYTRAKWTLPEAKMSVFKTYFDHLQAIGYSAEAKKLTPAVRFSTSDCGIGSCVLQAFLSGGPVDIPIGDALEIEHRYGNDEQTFIDQLPLIYARLGDVNEKLLKLSAVTINYPGNALTRVCKKLCLPKKESLETIAVIEAAFAGIPMTAEDAWFALHDILYKCKDAEESKKTALQEKFARLLEIKWADYDLPKGIEW